MNQTTQPSSSNLSESGAVSCDDDQVSNGIEQHEPVTDDEKKKSHHKTSINWATIRSVILPCFHLCNSSKGEKSAEDQLCEAAMKGDWKAAEKLDQKHKGILLSIINEDRKESALHIATRFNNTAFVKNLIDSQLNDLTEDHLEAENRYGNTPLRIAAISGAEDIAKLVVDRHKELVHKRVTGKASNYTWSQENTPILIAARYKQFHMVTHFLRAMDSPDKNTEILKKLLFSFIDSNDYEMALSILEENGDLALERDEQKNTPLHIMAKKSNGTIGAKNNPTKWQSSINKCCKHIYRNEIMQTKAHHMVEKLWKVVKDKIKDQNSENDRWILHPTSMLHDAASVGNVEFLRVILKEKPDLLRKLDKDQKTIFHVAVEMRQRNVFNLIYDMDLFNPDDLSYYFNEENKSLLDLTTKPIPSHLDQVSGAVFQMHQEYLWFKEVEYIERITIRKNRKEKEKTQESFIEGHTQLMKEGEEWVKSTANSCMLVATLIATVVFTAAFTVPGGNNGNNGVPLFLHHEWFTVFVISDSIALISSSTAILLFMSMLTSRRAKRDFLFWLPLQLVLGLGFLFLSVLGMVLAFGACLFLHFEKNISWIPLVITWMAIVPIYWFCVLQWKLWADGLAALHATGMSVLLKRRKNKMLNFSNIC